MNKLTIRFFSYVVIPSLFWASCIPHNVTKSLMNYVNIQQNLKQVKGVAIHYVKYLARSMLGFLYYVKYIGKISVIMFSISSGVFISDNWSNTFIHMIWINWQFDFRLGRKVRNVSQIIWNKSKEWPFIMLGILSEVCLVSYSI
jgi:hypothetical protein